MIISEKEYKKINGQLLYITGICLDCQKIIKKHREVNNLSDKELDKLLENFQKCIDKGRDSNSELDTLSKRKIDRYDIENINEKKELLDTMMRFFEKSRYELVIEQLSRLNCPVYII